MAFTSHIFLFYFLPAVLLLYYLAPRRWPVVRNALLLAAGYVFYAWVSWRFAALLLGLTVVNYVLSRLIAAAGGTRMRALPTGLAIAIDLAVLGFFKYIVFVEENLNSILLLVGRDALPMLKVVLPVGISFYTFKIVGYVVDVYRGQSPPARSLLDFACYVSFFPQLLSGPIQRFGTIDPKSDPVPTFAEQLAARGHTLDKFSWGASPVHAGIREENPPGQRGGPGGGRGLRRGVARDGGCVVRGPGVLVPVVLRFLRLLGDGHRHRADAGLRVPAELRRAVPGRQLRRLLASMAYLAVELAARLSVHPARRQSRRNRPDVCEPDDRVPAVRPVARGRLDVHRLGRLARALADRRANCEERQDLWDGWDPYDFTFHASRLSFLSR